MKLYIIGDSISLQYGPHLERALAGVMTYARKEGQTEALLNLDNPQGANGGDSSMVLAFMRTLAAANTFDADLLLVNCGLHDIKTNPATGARQVPIDTYERNLRAIVAVARDLRTQLIWMRTTPCDERIHNTPDKGIHRFAADVAACNAVADRVMLAAGVPVIDLHTFTQNLGPNLYCDHVHFHEHIREKQAAFIAGWLNAWTTTSRLRSDRS